MEAAEHGQTRGTCFFARRLEAVSYTHLRAHETDSYLVCRLLLEKIFEVRKHEDGWDRFESM